MDAPSDAPGGDEQEDTGFMAMNKKTKDGGGGDAKKKSKKK